MGIREAQRSDGLVFFEHRTPPHSSTPLPSWLHELLFWRGEEGRGLHLCFGEGVPHAWSALAGYGSQQVFYSAMVACCRRPIGEQWHDLSAPTSSHAVWHESKRHQTKVSCKNKSRHDLRLLSAVECAVFWGEAHGSLVCLVCADQGSPITSSEAFIRRVVVGDPSIQPHKLQPTHSFIGV